MDSLACLGGASCGRQVAPASPAGTFLKGCSMEACTMLLGLPESLWLTPFCSMMSRALSLLH